MGVLSSIFGADGGLTNLVFGLQFWVVFFILIFFVMMLFVNGVSAESLSLFILLFFIIIAIENPFNIPPQFVLMPIIFILLFMSIVFYNFLKNK